VILVLMSVRLVSKKVGLVRLAFIYLANPAAAYDCVTKKI